MPAHINYETTPIIFYKFVCENPEIKSCYVGHTTNFQQRKGSHKFNCKTEHDKKFNLKIYKIIRENGGWDNWKMVEIGRQICLDFSDACKIEQQYIEKLQANMNSRFAIRSDKQYEIDNKIKIAERKKKYRLENKEKFSKQFECDCGSIITICKKTRHIKTKKHLAYLETINNIDNIQNEF
jgi:hypothetical protein